MAMIKTFTLAAAVPALTEELQDVIVREAYLQKSLGELRQTYAVAKAQVQDLSASRPPFMFLQKRDVRQAFREASSTVTQDLATIERALALNEEMATRLHDQVISDLESWLKDHCAEYRVGLVSERFVSDWEITLKRFMEVGKSLMQRLGQARAAAAACYDRTRGRMSANALEFLQLAKADARTLEKEIEHTNSIASQHGLLLKGTVFSEPIPQLVPEPYAESIERLAELPPGEALGGEFDRLRAAIDDLLNRELTALRERVASSAKNQVDRRGSYVESAWQQLHAHACALSVDERLMPSVVAEIERDFNEARRRAGGAPWSRDETGAATTPARPAATSTVAA